MQRTLALTVDIEVGVLIAETGLPLTSIPKLFRGDRYRVEVSLKTVSWTGNAATLNPITPDPLYAYSIGMKQARTYGAGVLLASATLDIETAKLVADLDLDSSDLLAAIGSTDATLDVNVEIQAVTGGEPPTTLVQYATKIRNDVVRDNEGTPAPSGPTYYTAAQVSALFVPIAGAGVRVKSTGLEVLFPDAKWYRLTPKIVGGVPTHTWTEVES
jgi:hypothetical protein